MKVGFTCGSFDILHAGYIGLFAEAKKVCDYLIVGLQDDPSVDRPNKAKPVQSLMERTIVLYGNKNVDEVVPYRTEKELYELMKILPIDVYILGEDWKGREFTGHDLFREDQIHYNKRRHNLSATSLKRRVYGRVGETEPHT